MDATSKLNKCIEGAEMFCHLQNPVFYEEFFHERQKKFVIVALCV